MQATTTANWKVPPGEMIAGDPIARAAKADPFGDRIHTILFVLWAFTLPLGMIPWAKDVAFGGLIVWSVLRATVGHVGYAWSDVPRNPLAWLLVLWAVWSSLSLIWSGNPAFGFDQLGGLRMLAVPFAAWPVLRKWRMVLAGFVLGGTLIAAGVVGQSIGWIPTEFPGRAHRPSMSMGVWAAGLVCVTTLLGHFLLIGIKAGAASVVWHLGGVVITLMAVVLNATRSCWLALIVAGVGGLIVLIVLIPTLRWRIFLIATAATTGVAVAATIDDAFLESRGATIVLRRMSPAMEQLGDSTGFAANRGTVNYRRKMWNGGRNIIIKNPIAGSGLGGFSSELTKQPGLAFEWPYDKDSIDQQQFNPHSSYVYQGASTGLVGLLVMLGTLGVAVIRMGLRIRGEPLAIVPLAMLSAWIVVSTFESTLLSGVGVGLMTFFLIPAMAPAGSTDADSPA
jgi:O-antigen ligase